MSNLFQKLKYSNHHSSSQPTISNVSSNINSNENNFSNNSRYVSKSEADKIGLYSPTHLDTTTLEAMTHLENIILFDPGPVLEEAEGLNEISVRIITFGEIVIGSFFYTQRFKSNLNIVFYINDSGKENEALR